MIYKSILIGSLIISVGFTDNLSLEKAVKLSIQNDSWLIENKYNQKSIELKSISAGSYPDPKLSVNMLNLPTDSFDINQEAMTQLKVGISQQFPRGDSLKIKQEQLKLQASKYPYQRENRKTKVIVEVSQLWFEIYKIQETINIITKNRALFEQLLDISESSYSSALGKTRQHDIIRAELELTNLDDRITILEQKKDKLSTTLSQWFYSLQNEELSSKNLIDFANLTLPKDIFHVQLINQIFYKSSDENNLLEEFEKHPAIKSINKEIEAITKERALAKEKYKPQFALNTSYSYRDDDPSGKTRSDLISAGFTFDIPLFTKNRQDKDLESSIQKIKAIKSKKELKLRSFLSSYETIKAQLMRLKQREKLYVNKLIPQTYEQSEAALNAYTNDDGDFAEVVRSRIAQLNKDIDALNIKVDIEKNIIKYNYLFSENVDQMLNTINTKGKRL